MPTTQEKIDALQGLAHTFGYSEKMIQHEFPVWVGREVKIADVVAFGRARPEPQDQTTSAIVGAASENGVQQAIDIATAIAAPVAAIASEEVVDIWAIAARGEHQKLYQLDYNDVSSPPSALVQELGPRSLTAGKEGIYQPALFPSDVGALLQEARKKSASGLINLVESTATDLSSGHALSTPHDKQKEISRIARLLIGAMAALMVSDKVVVTRGQSAKRILLRAEERFPSYFQWTSELKPSERDNLLRTISRLGEDVSYAGLDPSVVALVYETAILDTAKRADFGVFYTPPELARRVLAQIPIEEIEPSQRSVLDPSCGSGTFLLAAYDRLRDIAPLELDLIKAHHDTGKRLAGFDIDPLAVEVARLALLLNAMPASNGWRITQADALDPKAEAGTGSTVVVSNPPWRDIRSDQGTRAQLADRFLMRMIELVKPGGFLATVVPAGWLVSSTSRSTRSALAEQCSLFEVWRLPQDTFPGADIDVAVLLAKRDQPPGKYVFRRVRRTLGWKSRFLENDDPGDEVLLRDVDSSLRLNTWTHGPLDRYRERLQSCEPLKTIAKVHKGPVPTPPVGERGGQGDFLWLSSLRGTRAYAQPSKDILKLVRYPDEFNWRQDDGAIYRRPKVMVSGVRNPDIAWRTKVIPDLGQGIIPRDSLLMVVPWESKDILALTALLGSSFVSCWIDTLNPGRSITVRLLEEVPLPSSANWRQVLCAAGERLVEQAEEAKPETALLTEIDRQVLDCYELPARAYRDLSRYFAGMPAPEGGVRYPARHSERNNLGDNPRSSYGTVLELGSDKLKLWIAGVTKEDGEWVDLPIGFPGSQLYPGATFEVVIPEGKLRDGRFRFQSESYLELDDVIASGG